MSLELPLCRPVLLLDRCRVESSSVPQQPSPLQVWGGGGGGSSDSGLIVVVAGGGRGILRSIVAAFAAMGVAVAVAVALCKQTFFSK